MDDLNNLEDALWAAADHLRANSELTAAECCTPVLNLIFRRRDEPLRPRASATRRLPRREPAPLRHRLRA